MARNSVLKKEDNRQVKRQGNIKYMLLKHVLHFKNMDC